MSKVGPSRSVEQPRQSDFHIKGKKLYDFTIIVKTNH